jgi:hypothetical protein
MQKTEKINLDSKEISHSDLGFPHKCSVSVPGPQGSWGAAPACRLSLLIFSLRLEEEIADSSLTQGIKVGTIQYFTIRYKLHLSSAFHAWHLKVLYDPLSKRKRKKRI